MTDTHQTDETKEQPGDVEPPDYEKISHLSNLETVLGLQEAQIRSLSDEQLIGAAIATTRYTARLHERVTGELEDSLTDRQVALENARIGAVGEPIRDELARRFADDTDADAGRMYR